MSESIEKQFESFMCNAMTSYRTIPLLAILADTTKKFSIDKMAAHIDIRKILEKALPDILIEDSLNMLVHFLQEHRGWIEYALADMSRYAELFFFDNANENMEEIRMRMYSRYTLAQSRFTYLVTGAFGVDSSIREVKLLDIGCGPFTHFENFEKANMGRLSTYTGIDKRNMSGYAKDVFDKSKQHGQIQFIQGDITKDLLEEIPPYNVLFFGNILHCLKVHSEMYTLIKCFITDTVKQIFVLEPNFEELGLGLAFGFHMRMHGGCFVNEKVISNLAMQLGMDFEIRTKTEQYIMYVLT